MLYNATWSARIRCIADAPYAQHLKKLLKGCKQLQNGMEGRCMMLCSLIVGTGFS